MSTGRVVPPPLRFVGVVVWCGVMSNKHKIDKYTTIMAYQSQHLVKHYVQQAQNEPPSLLYNKFADNKHIINVINIKNAYVNIS